MWGVEMVAHISSVLIGEEILGGKKCKEDKGLC